MYSPQDSTRLKGINTVLQVQGDVQNSSTQHYHTLGDGKSMGYYDDINHAPRDCNSGTSELVSDDTADDNLRHSEPAPSRNLVHTTQLPESSESQTEHSNDLGVRYDYRAVPGLMKSPSLDNAQKMAILAQCPHPVLNRLYEEHMATHGLQRPSTASTFPPKPEDLNEDNYQPLDADHETPPDLNARRPIYPAYAGHFVSAQDAKTYRKRTRIAPKAHAPDVDRVKRYGRQYWVRRIYEAMINVTAISDGESSIHRQRFTDTPGFDATDLEATAHHVFDSALAVHERGWNRPKIYHKKVVRGKLTDVSEKSLETRLARICLCLKQKKATVDDAVRGGVTLALLCDNPEARGFTKMSNNTGNKKRGERLRLAKGTDEMVQQQRSDDD